MPGRDDMSSDVEVLKSQINSLERMMVSFGEKLDSFVTLQIRIAELTNEHNSTKAALDRAFTAIKENKNRTEHVSTFTNKVIGGVAVLMFCAGVFQYFIFREVEQYDNLKKQVIAQDRRLDNIVDSLIRKDK